MFTRMPQSMSLRQKNCLNIAVDFFFQSKSPGQLQCKFQKIKQNDGENLKNLHIYM